MIEELAEFNNIFNISYLPKKIFCTVFIIKINYFNKVTHVIYFAHLMEALLDLFSFMSPPPLTDKCLLDIPVMSLYDNL